MDDSKEGAVSAPQCPARTPGETHCADCMRFGNCCCLCGFSMPKEKASGDGDISKLTATDAKAEREHIVEVFPIDMAKLRAWIAAPNGGLALADWRLILEAVEHGGILVRTYPYGTKG